MSFVVGVAAVQAEATSFSTPGNPVANSTVTATMAGLAGAITPAVSGNVFILITGTIFNPTLIADGASVQISYGTGTAPVNAATLTGTRVGGIQKYVNATVSEKSPFAVGAVVTGLALGTAYWIDLAVAAITAGAGTVTDCTISAFEI